MAKNSKDLFDESTMSFGDHLEVLRVHLWKAIVGLVLGVLLTLVFGNRLVAVIRKPIDDQLRARGVQTQDDIGGFNLWEYFKARVTGVPQYTGTADISDAGIKLLESLKSLQQVDLTGTGVTTRGLLSLKRALPQVDIEVDPVTVAGLAEFTELGARCQLNADYQPVSLALSGSEIADEHLEKLARLTTLAKLITLDLRETRISDEGLALLRSLTNLEQLNLVGTEISDSGLKQLAPLKKLRILLVSSPKITDEGMKTIAGLTALEQLNLVGTSVSNDGLKELERLKKLRTLAVSGPDIDNVGLATLAKFCPQLTRLDLAGTRITDKGFRSLPGFQDLKVFKMTRDVSLATSGGVDDPFADVSEQATVVVLVRPSRLAEVLHRANPQQYPRIDPVPNEKRVPLELAAGEFAMFRETTERVSKPITLNVQEAFMTYLKVALVGGLVLSSPWIFYQVWLFVAAGLYSHERKYVYIYLPFSMFLFIGGAVFCFYAVFPFVLKFLLGFNDWLEVTPQIRLSEWISFAVLLPLLFGVSFQLPLVMLFLEKLSIFDAKTYREKRRVAILVISIISMLLTPADPASMVMMMMPLVLLYELGILLCQYMATRNPFQPETI